MKQKRISFVSLIFFMFFFSRKITSMILRPKCKVHNICSSFLCFAYHQLTTVFISELQKPKKKKKL